MKPSGLTVIPGNEAHRFLAKMPAEKVWGIGSNTSAYLQKLGVITALDFAVKDFDWVCKNFTKPHIEIWQELRGVSVIKLDTEEKHDYASIQKVKTFTPPSKDRTSSFRSCPRISRTPA